MTILGAHVLAPDLAVAWTDSETYRETDDLATGMRPKLAINAAGFAFALAGWQRVAIAGAHCVTDAPDFATALARLPGVLRRASEQAAMGSRRPEIYGTQHAYLVGFDWSAYGMVAYRFAAAECFVPVLDFEQLEPCPAMPGGRFAPTGRNEVMLLAERQMDVVRQSIPHARGGPLYAAVIRPASITVERLCDLSDTAPAPAAASEPEKEPAHVR